MMPGVSARASGWAPGFPLSAPDRSARLVGNPRFVGGLSSGTSQRMASGQQPQQFGKYTLVEKIAVGGMAEIYRAKTFGAAGFEKDLVIKRILSQFSNDEEFVRMFIDEARLAAKLQHANVVQIFDFDGVEAPPGEISYYIAMEWVDGKDLRHLLKEGARRRDPLSAAAAVHVAVETLKGLHYAHTRSEGGRPLGIVHRDVSPHNVLVSYSGDVKISDFGIAKAAARAAVTTNGMVKGKIAYMSPEQVTGQPLDRRTDVFSMGVVLYEMLTGSRLFAGDSEKDVIANVRDAVVEPPRARNPDIPVDLERVLMKMLAASPEGRYPTAADAAKALTATSAYSPSEGIALGEHLARLFPPSEKRSTVPARPAPEIGRCASPSPPGMPRATGAPVTPPRPLASPDAIATMIGEAPATPAPAWSAPPPSPRPAPGPLSDERTFILDRAAAGGSPSRGVPARAASVNEEQTVILDG